MTFDLGDERLPRRVWDHITVDQATGCWRWTGQHIGRLREYGCLWWKGKHSQLIHRVVYSELVGPIPDGLQIDHVAARGCRFKDCCNPAHLEPVTPRVNVLRGDTITAANAAKEACPAGHAYDAANTYSWDQSGGRQCRACKRERMRERRAAGKDKPKPRTAEQRAAHARRMRRQRHGDGCACCCPE